MNVLGGLFTSNYQSTQSYIDDSTKRLEGTPYADLLVANPWLNYEYTPSVWDKLGNFFGFNTTEDKLRLDYQQKAKDWASQVMTTKFENDYNSESARAQRMREAGQNPDLLGTNGVAPATEFAEPEPAASIQEVGTQGMQLCQVLLGVLDSSMSFASKFVDIESAINSMDWMSNSNSIATAKEIAEFLFQEPSLASDSGDLDSNALSAAVKSSVLDLGLTGRNARRVRKYTPMFVNSMETARKYWNDKNSAHLSRTEYLQRSHSMYNGELDEGSDVIIKAMQPMIDWLDKYGSISLQANIEGAQNNLDYNKTFDGSLSASSANTLNRESRDAKEADNELREAWRGVIHALSSEAKKGSKLATIGLLILNALQNYIGSNARINIGPAQSVNNFKSYTTNNNIE